MSQLGCRNEITDREYSRHRCPHPLVDTDIAALVDLDPRVPGHQSVGERAAADRHQDRLDLELLAIPEDHRGVITVGLVPGDHDASPHGDAALGERPDDHVGHVLVATGKDLGQGLQQRDLHTEIGQHRGELAADGTGADHRRRARKFTEVQQLVRGQHVTAVDLEAGKASRDRTRSKHDIGPGDDCHGSVRSGDLDDPAREQASDTREDRDLALMQEARKPFEELVDYPVLPVLADGELDDGLARMDAELLGPLDAAEHCGGLEEFLRRHATAMQAGAAHLVLLHHGHRQSRGTRIQSNGVPARPTTDDDYVELRRLSSVRWQTDHLLGSTTTRRPEQPSAGRARVLCHAPRPAFGLSLKPCERPDPQPVGRRSIPAATVALVCSSTSTKLPVSLLSRYSS